MGTARDIIIGFSSTWKDRFCTEHSFEDTSVRRRQLHGRCLKQFISLITQLKLGILRNLKLREAPMIMPAESEIGA